MTSELPFLDADVVSALTPAAAVRALREALADGLDPAADPARWAVPTEAGELLLMPATGPTFAGVKIATVAPGNPDRGLPRIQGIYLLLDAATLTPRALLDAVAMTTLRTAAVSTLAATLLAPASAGRAVVFGTGPQASAHVAALAALFPLEQLTVVGRSPEHVTAFVQAWSARLPRVVSGAPGAVADADLVVCATTARDPLFEMELVADHAVLLAVGSHQPGVLELPPELLGRATVVVEDPATASREAGEVIAAMERRLLRTADLVPLADLAAGRALVPDDRPRVFKSVGMAWEDRVVAEAILTAHSRGQGATDA